MTPPKEPTPPGGYKIYTGDMGVKGLLKLPKNNSSNWTPSRFSPGEDIAPAWHDVAWYAIPAHKRAEPAKKEPTKPAYPWICPECDGKRKVYRPVAFSASTMQVDCPNCRGEGLVWTEKPHATIGQVPHKFEGMEDAIIKRFTGPQGDTNAG